MCYCDCVEQISNIKLHIYRKALSDLITHNVFNINYLTDITDTNLNAVFYNKIAFNTFSFISSISDGEDTLAILTYNIFDRFNFRVVKINKKTFEGQNELIAYCDVFEEINVIPEFNEIIDDILNKANGSVAIPAVDHVWFNDPYTSITWTDGTVTKCRAAQDDIFNKDSGVAICLAKRFLMNEGAEYPRSFIKQLVKDGIDLKKIKEKKHAKKLARKGIDAEIVINTSAFDMKDIVVDPADTNSITIPVIPPMS